MKLVVVTLSGASVKLDSVDPVASVGDIKRKAVSTLFDSKPKFGRSLSSYRLMHKGVRLDEDGWSLVKSGIRDGATLTIVTIAATVLAAGCFDGSVRVLNSATREERSWEFGQSVVSVAYSNTGTCLAVSSDFGVNCDGQIAVFVIDSGQTRGPCRQLIGPAAGISWASEGDEIAAVDVDSVQILKADGGQASEIQCPCSSLASVRLGKALLTCVAWNPDSSSIAVAAGGFNACGGVSILNPTNGKAIWQWDCWRAVHSLSWSPDGARLAAASGDTRHDSGSVNIILDSAIEQCWKLLAIVRCVCWSPDGTRVAAAATHLVAGTGSVHIFILGSDEEERLWEFESYARSVAWSPDGERLAVALDDRSLRVIVVATGEEDCRWDFPSGGATSIAWAPTAPLP